MRTRIFAIIFIGMTIGFLLALGVIALLRDLIDGEDTKLAIAFTVLVSMMATGLLWYVVKSTR